MKGLILFFGFLFLVSFVGVVSGEGGICGRINISECGIDSNVVTCANDYKNNDATIDDLSECTNVYSETHRDGDKPERMSALVECLFAFKDKKKTLIEFNQCVIDFKDDNSKKENCNAGLINGQFQDTDGDGCHAGLDSDCGGIEGVDDHTLTCFDGVDNDCDGKIDSEDGDQSCNLECGDGICGLYERLDSSEYYCVNDCSEVISNKDDVDFSNGGNCTFRNITDGGFLGECIDKEDPLDVFSVKYHLVYDSDGNRSFGDDLYFVRIDHKGGEVIDLSEVVFVVRSERGITLYYDFGSGKIGPGEVRTYELRPGPLRALSEGLCEGKFSFALGKKGTDRLYSYDGGEALRCVKVVLASEDEGPIDISSIEIGGEVVVGEESELICGGCELENKCYPFGYRKGGNYCSDDENEFTGQIDEGLLCENNFECSSYVCVSGECVSEGLLKKILNWFKGLFG
jgi:hypothetical protein